MKAKIDLEKFICSMLQYAEDNCEETMLDYLHSALQDQGLEYKDGEIVEIAHEPEFKLEIGKWYKCILTPVVHKHFTVGKVYECELEGCLADDTDEDRIVDLDLECFRRDVLGDAPVLWQRVFLRHPDSSCRARRKRPALRCICRT